MMPTQIGIRRPDPLGPPIAVTTTGLGFFGGDFASEFGSSYMVTHSLPFAPIFSIGAFQNAIANGQTDFGSQGKDMLQPAITHPIGNSFAPSVIGKADLRGNVGTFPAADHSYLANLGLWDDYFFSSIAPVTTTSNKNPATAQAEQKAAFKNFADPGVAVNVPLPNPRIRSFIQKYSEAETKLFPSSSPATGQEPFRISGSLLGIDGAFNVNSVSVKAWTSFLMGLKGTDVPTLDPLSPGGNLTLINDTDTPVASLLGAAGGKIDASLMDDPAEPTQWRGFRSLSDQQVADLAEKLVEKVRAYGPFLSIADFVNRRPDATTEMALVGPLQAAIDATDINQGYDDTPSRVTTGANSDFAFPEAENGSKSVGIPGYVKQGDLLTTMGPLITVRGDTFLIRAYGDARDSNNNITARAWCEATVQRTPDYLDPADSNHTQASGLSELNKTFGRRFEVVSFRFLNPAEIR